MRNLQFLIKTYLNEEREDGRVGNAQNYMLVKSAFEPGVPSGWSLSRFLNFVIRNLFYLYP